MSAKDIEIFKGVEHLYFNYKFNLKPSEFV